MQNYQKQMNELGKRKIPFLFLLDFELQSPMVFPLESLNSEQILFDLNGFANVKHTKTLSENFFFKKFPPNFETYKHSFDLVQRNLHHGNSFLTNLTFSSPIESNLSLKDIFYASQAKYKLCFEDKFVFFSPETFVQINNQIISSCPMKGTIDASVPQAATKILQNEKEFAEHATIVDLIRNDLSMISEKVEVEKFRYLDKIITHDKELLQVSSKITGKLPKNYLIGDIFATLLPAGSICGAPKKKTIEIIKEAENYDRGFYTGVCGYFDGEKLDSCVMIRFIEQINSQKYFKSGGGITAYSEVESEYQELIQKIYVPIIRKYPNLSADSAKY